LQVLNFSFEFLSYPAVKALPQTGNIQDRLMGGPATLQNLAEFFCSIRKLDKRNAAAKYFRRGFMKPIKPALGFTHDTHCATF